MPGQPGHNTIAHARLTSSFQGMDAWMFSEPSDLQATWVIGVLGLFFDMLSLGASTTRHWQTSGRLVQELDVCTVPAQRR